MLWAGDYVSAYRELAGIIQRYSWLIMRALEVKKKQTAIYKNNKGIIEEKLKAQGLKGINLENRVKQAIAESSTLTDDMQDALYILSPLAGIISSFDRKISDYLGIPPIIRRSYIGRVENLNISDIEYDPDSGFRYSIMEQSQGNWNIKAYRLDFDSIDASRFSQSLKNIILDTHLVDMNKQDNPIFPLWFRAFRQDSFIEITIYDQNRFMLSVISDSDETTNRVVSHILSSITKIASAKH